jgi:hypothetical protein
VLGIKEKWEKRAWSDVYYVSKLSGRSLNMSMMNIWYPLNILEVENCVKETGADPAYSPSLIS